MPEVPAQVRSKLAISLDVDDLVVALRLARQLAPWFGTAKVGLELYSSVGPDAVTSLTELGFDLLSRVTDPLHRFFHCILGDAFLLGFVGNLVILTAGDADAILSSASWCLLLCHRASPLIDQSKINSQRFRWFPGDGDCRHAPLEAGPEPAMQCPKQGSG